LTSRSASVGVEGIVNLFVRDQVAFGGHKRQAALLLGLSVQALCQMPKQLLLLEAIAAAVTPRQI
jgi:hypothetical protein